MRLLRPSFFVLLIESGVVSSCTRSHHIRFQACKWGVGCGVLGAGCGVVGWDRYLPELLTRICPGNRKSSGRVRSSATHDITHALKQCIYYLPLRRCRIYETT